MNLKKVCNDKVFPKVLGTYYSNNLDKYYIGIIYIRRTSFISEIGTCKTESKKRVSGTRNGIQIKFENS